MGSQRVPLGRGRFFERTDRPGLMAIINVTPDSFSDGGECVSVEQAVARARAAVAQRAVLVDIGGESTRPGAEPVDYAEEERRVVPVVRAVVERVGVPVSVDTRCAAVFSAAYNAGACMLNDVSALAHDADMAAAAARSEAAVLLMHMRGTPQNMDTHAHYNDVVAEVCAELSERLQSAEKAGVPRERLLADPGLGFAKDTAHNLTLLQHLPELAALGVPLVLGLSRKRFLGALCERSSPAERADATVALIACIAAEPIALLRVHAPGPAQDALAVALALRANT
ncbi:MAG: dihydropteroate synthase [Planctomycetes bacterium]|nr:dihydropteroate synthase [Planctomycetota bacterium]